MQTLGIDVGSSSIKIAVYDSSQEKTLARAFFPENELSIEVPFPDWAEQQPDVWWHSLKGALRNIKHQIVLKNIEAIGISYQMHGLVAIDKNLIPVRPAIIWCDSRAVKIGEEAFNALKNQDYLDHHLNAPGNFTASKLAWVKENEPEIYSRIWKFMLPGDYVALKLSGNATTTQAGLSECALWDFKNKRISTQLMDYYEFSETLIPDIVPSIGVQCYVSQWAAKQLGLTPEIPITYRAGDQPNNALSLNVLKPGELATTAGTSAVIYGVTDKPIYDTKSRINTFLHVNNTLKNNRNGILLCVNGSGILYSWLKKLLNTTTESIDYNDLNNLSEQAPPGSLNLRFFPFGNGAERILENKNLKAQMSQLDFNVHDRSHLIRSAKEGIVFSMRYGLDIIHEMGIPTTVIKAGNNNLFQSPMFRNVFVNTMQMPLALYDTDGAEGAARAALAGHISQSLENTFKNMNPIDTIYPEQRLMGIYQEQYGLWKKDLSVLLADKKNGNSE
ncbi:MAG: carbohydrate kinase [Flammeovirgaceae bacterium]|nr:carbohydrate kinase [Flammeovirgaceae bacterium]|tara:strand:+ start:190 stop:1698 length:1509 start_codon:yes stop_codon:yes gene_type:complete